MLTDANRCTERLVLATTRSSQSPKSKIDAVSLASIASVGRYRGELPMNGGQYDHSTGRTDMVRPSFSKVHPDPGTITHGDTRVGPPEHLVHRRSHLKEGHVGAVVAVVLVIVGIVDKRAVFLWNAVTCEHKSPGWR